jgi:hypothetical protein
MHTILTNHVRVDLLFCLKPHCIELFTSVRERTSILILVLSHNGNDSSNSMAASFRIIDLSKSNNIGRMFC